MASSYRYKYVQNSTGSALTAANFPITNDGDDKQNKLIKHVLVAADFGGEAGKVDNIGGLILDVIPSNYNVLWFDTTVYRPFTADGITQYNNITNQVTVVDVQGDTYESFDTVFWLGLDNTLRFFDKGHGQDDAKLAIGDVIIARITIGQPQDPRDKMNP